MAKLKSLSPKLYNFTPKIEGFFSKLKHFSANIKEFAAKLKISANLFAPDGGQTLKKQACIRSQWLLKNDVPLREVAESE